LRERHRRALAAFGESGAAALPMSGRPPLPALHADGHEFPIEAAVSQLHVGGQRLYTVILRDVSERLRADEAIRTAKAKLDAALASMTDGLAIFDAADRLVEFNDAFAAYHRFASKDECLRTLTEYPALFEVSMSDGTPLPPQRWPARRALGGETGINVEFTIRRQDSGERWIGSYSFAPIRAAGGAIDGAVLVMRDVTALHTIHAELQASHAALRRLVAAQDSVQEAERKRVARELHDDLQQTLAAIKMDTVAIGLQLRQDPARVAPMLTKIDELATAAIASTRRIVNDLRPQMLEELGLLAALEALAADFAQRTGIDCRVDSDGDVELEPSVATCLYRVAQESLNNVLKHADARQVQIAIGCDGDRVRLNVRDDGKGLQATDRHKPHSFGLVGMSERVHAAGGSLRIDSAPARGTRVEVEVPAAAVDDELPIGVA
jgi:signal transduction histidine kinase